LSCLIFSYLVPLARRRPLNSWLLVIHHKDIKQGTFWSCVDLSSLLVPCSVLSCHLLCCLILYFLLLRSINALPATPHHTQTLPQTL
jgi:hypothetical protein